MPLSLTTYADADTVDASDIRSKLDDIEDFVNEEIVVGDLKATTWVQSTHIFKPEFYGSPAPRTHAVSGHTHYRNTPHGTADQAHFHPGISSSTTAIHGACATLKIPRDNTKVSILASMWVFEAGGAILVTGGNNWETTRAGTITVRTGAPGQGFTAVSSTERDVWFNTISGSAPSLVGRKQITYAVTFELDEGIREVGLFMRTFLQVLGVGGRVAVDVRSFIVDIHDK